MGLHFAHFGLESGIVFDGTTGVYERICYFSSKMNTELRKSNIQIRSRYHKEITQSLCVTITSKFPIYMRLKDFPFFVHKKSTGYRRLFVLKTQCSLQ